MNSTIYTTQFTDQQTNIIADWPHSVQLKSYLRQLKRQMLLSINIANPIVDIEMSQNTRQHIAQQVLVR